MIKKAILSYFFAKRLLQTQLFVFDTDLYCYIRNVRFLANSHFKYSQ